MKRIFLLFHLVFLAFALCAHPWKSQHYVIVDTDCGLDDFRAICLLLSSPDVRILAITTSDGVTDATTGFYKVKSLLNELNHQGILVGCNPNQAVKANTCPPALAMEWGAPVQDDAEPPGAADIVNYVLNNTREKITFLSLGSLNTSRLCAEKCPEFTARVLRILWSSAPDYTTNNFNYSLDKISADAIISGSVPLNLVYGSSRKQYDDILVGSISRIHTRLSGMISESLITPETHYAKALFDELTVLYIHFPGMFQEKVSGGPDGYRLQDEETGNNILTAYIKILLGENVSRNQVLEDFPIDTISYFDDIQVTMQTTLKKYGREEWVSAVIANELHRHLGVYAVIGVKMGIRAREFFGAGVDEMHVASYAGLTPPFSCMNDGLQVSTGATLGHGLISVVSDTLKLPQADFVYMNRKIRLFLNPEIRTKVESEIRELSRIYGLDSNIYWELVRKAAIRYWAEFDRNEIFTIQLL
jgi:hypothetical protein